MKRKGLLRLRDWGWLMLRNQTKLKLRVNVLVRLSSYSVNEPERMTVVLMDGDDKIGVDGAQKSLKSRWGLKDKNAEVKRA